MVLWEARPRADRWLNLAPAAVHRCEAQLPRLRRAPIPTRLSLVWLLDGGKPMDTFNIHEAKTHFSKLVDSVMQGNEIVIAKSGKAAVKLVPISSVKPKLRLGVLKGRIRIADDFDAPLADEVLAGFEGR
jgi:prevent-host-death family protein